jgi:hypothetical protein
MAAPGKARRYPTDIDTAELEKSPTGHSSVTSARCPAAGSNSPVSMVACRVAPLNVPM